MVADNFFPQLEQKLSATLEAQRVCKTTKLCAKQQITSPLVFALFLLYSLLHAYYDVRYEQVRVLVY